MVGDVRNDPARPEPELMTYASVRQDPWGYRSFVLRTQGDPLSLLRPFERELAALDPGVPVNRAMTLRALLSEGLAGRRLPVVLMTAFSVLLACATAALLVPIRRATHVDPLTVLR